MGESQSSREHDTPAAPESLGGTPAAWPVPRHLAEVASRRALSGESAADAAVQALRMLTLDKDAPQRVGGVHASANALAVLLVAEAAAKQGASLLVLAPGAEAAEGLAADMRIFAATPPASVPSLKQYAPAAVHEFAALSDVPSPHEPVPAHTAKSRLDFLLAALAVQEGRPGEPAAPFVGVAPVSALMQALKPPERVSRATLTLKLGDTLDAQQLLAQLIAEGFVATSMVEYPGEVSVRGGIVDVFPHAARHPLRIELFGDEIDSLRPFDVATQTSFDHADEVELLLAGDPVALPTEAGGFPKFATLLDYLPAPTWLVLLEPHRLVERAELAKKSWPLRPPFRSGERVLSALDNHPRLELHELRQGHEGAVNLDVSSVEPLIGDLNDEAAGVAELSEHYGEVRILVRNDVEARRVQQLLEVRGVDLEAPGFASLKIAQGEVEEGFLSPSLDLAVLQSVELLQKTRLKRSPLEAVQRTQAVHDYLDLKEGDFVVHVTHGIAQYRGLSARESDGITDEYLELEFAEGKVLHVPVVNCSLVQKYIGARGAEPELSRLGTKWWSLKKQAAEEAVLDMAGELIKLQAERGVRPGVQVPPDDEAVLDFIADFPFEETRDQEIGDAEIRGDMQASKPMDRLLCGDVGYGKTELAMRAVMRAANAGYQVAVLVPTTVLAEQHYRTFSERFRNTPITIERLSRFRTGQTAKQTLEQVSRGSVDVLIGTHRILSQDVSFANLGLVVIDEEQRFGVRHKERLKHLRANVDVLTMTATPIPRTLHQSLLGIRDITTLATAPQDRLAIHTEVREHDEELIRDAILRELDRDGQCFFVHNTVYDLASVAGRIQQLVPEARITHAHGQMSERALQRAMQQFIDREVDVLVATTIVESGLDIPTANTLFVNRADRFGLAELHQIRGRVGRYRHRAYAYFLLDPTHALSEIARRRMRAIAEYSHLGAGFHIAMRDLEIRGAGNILGYEQSGHIAAIGYDLYCKLLQQAVARLKQ